ncbi:phosphotransferase family enzyme [Salsuginibacillus halophilus]|uniref:Phosphotransferase family enzyme n=1 Tax=Salsuginibacillus halophilus TaxID=517424 RepID=A0A2P8HAJ8_9BACI|nr:aminoglycoside phosphotransferase family protein [Salsuginibacillus halophilus]PSL43248.1 phosphotransferase family enzyme [Salsuginibacillus halophilus]
MKTLDHELLHTFIIYAEKDEAILVDVDSIAISLPSYRAKASHIAVTNHINRYLENEYNIKTNVIKCHYENEKQRVFVVELIQEKGLLPSKAKWLHNHLDKLSDGEKKILKSWRSASRQVSLPWFKFGWRNRMEAWLEKTFYDDSLRVEQVRSWERSALFKVIGQRESYFVKAVPSVFSHEPLVSRFLHQYQPLDVPEIIDAEMDQNCYVMKELKGPLLGETTNMTYWKEAVLSLADIQKNSLEHIEQLKELKCPVRPVSNIIQDYSEGTLYKLYRSNYIQSEVYQKLIVTLPRLINKSELLKSTNVPLALEHGDFFGGNIIVQDGKSVIYDWSDCCLSHPFLSVVTFLEEVEQFFSKAAALALLDEYLEQWNMFASKEALAKEYELIKSIAPAYGLTVYQTFIFPNFNDNWDKQQIVDGYINSWVKALDME